MEEEEVEVPVVKEQQKEATKMETDEAAPNDAVPPSSSETDVNMQESKGSTDAPGSENGVPESGDKPTQMETDNKVNSQLTCGCIFFERFHILTILIILFQLLLVFFCIDFRTLFLFLLHLVCYG